jgi:hypothetical protein
MIKFTVRDIVNLLYGGNLDAEVTPKDIMLIFVSILANWNNRNGNILVKQFGKDDYGTSITFSTGVQHNCMFYFNNEFGSLSYFEINDD